MRPPPVVRALRVAAVIATVAFAVTRLPALRAILPLSVTAVLINGVYIVATLLLVCRAVAVPKHRVAWAMLAAALSCYTSATFYSWAVTGGVTFLPFPSQADAGWLLMYPLASIGLALLIRAQVAHPRTRVLLEVLVAGLGAAALLSMLSIHLLVKITDTGSLLSTITLLAYPTGDAVLLGMALCLFCVGGHAARRDLSLLITSVLAFTVADTGYVALASGGAYHPGDVIDIAYLVALTLMGLSAWRRERRPSGHENKGVPLVLPIVFALSSLAVLLVATTNRTSPVPIVFAGATLVVVVMLTVVTFRQITAMALHDTLTGLPNRALIVDRMEQLLVRNRRNGTHGAALYIDLDGFKNVNDTLGHEAGDQLLRSVAERLTATLRDADTVGRMGGDEFVVLIDGGTLAMAPDLVAQRLLDVMRQPFELDRATRPVVVTASIGIAVGDRRVTRDLLRDADMALYRAKGAGRNCFEVFSAEMESDDQKDFELAFDLRVALENEQFRMVFQPVYNLADLSMVGAEALIRWEHPTLGVVQPDRFIPLLEASGHIVDIGRWVLLESCRQMKEWNDWGYDLTVAVNVSGRQLDRDSILDHVAEALTVSGLEPSRLVLEVTETALMKDTDMSARRLRSLKELGIQVAIDDFGTGYSSLAYLQKLPVDCLKIDRTFTDAIARSPESDALIHSLVRLGKDLGLKTVAEGVETPVQLDQLRSEGVNEAQGFLFARPLSPEAFEKQLLLLNQTTDGADATAPAGSG